MTKTIHQATDLTSFTNEGFFGSENPIIANEPLNVSIDDIPSTPVIVERAVYASTVILLRLSSLTAAIMILLENIFIMLLPAFGAYIT